VGLTLDNLSYAFMIGGEARKGKWSIFTDLILLGIDSHHDTVESVRFPSASGRVAVDADPNSETSTSLDALEWTLAGGYVVTRGGPFSVEVIAGVRHLTVEAESEWRIAGTITGPGPGQSFDREGGASQRVDLWDGIVGVRGQLALGKRWFLPFHADIGAGSSDLTWQAIAGVGYSFGSWDLRLAYRHLHYDTAEDELLQGVSFSGVGIGAKIRF
jgi:opacity protein-like surface antigen